MTRPERPEHILVVYNTDYDEELKETSGADVSAVEEAAEAVRAGVEKAGFSTSIVGVEGPDLPKLIERLHTRRPDMVFNLCESLCGNTDNELVVPALLDLFQIPYTGPDAMAIGTCLDKGRTKEVLTARGIATPAYVMIEDVAALSEVPDDLPYPMFLKLAREDASVGISVANRVEDRGALVARAKELLEGYNKQPVLAEAYVDGKEVNVTVCGNGREVQCLPLHEIDFAKMPDGSPHIVSYAAKWDENHPEYAGTLPVPLSGVSDETVAAIEGTAVACFRALGLRDFARVDLRVDKDGVPWVIDINPNCDLSPGAGVARAAEKAGWEYHDLVGRICHTAWKRYGDLPDTTA